MDEAPQPGPRARTEGIYLVRREVLQSLGATSNSFLLNLEIPIRAKRAGYRVKTVFMSVHDRIAGHSKATSFKRIQQTFTELFRLRVRMERERFAGTAPKAGPDHRPLPRDAR